MTSLPSKLFFRIGEVAGLVGVEPHVLRYWEREFRSIRPTKSAKGQRVYSRKDVENLLRVRDLLYRDGFTIAGAKKRLQKAPGEAEEHEPKHERAVEDLEARDESEDGVDDEEAEPESGAVLVPPAATSSASGSAARAKLTALRTEVEAFLEELESREGAPELHERA